MSTIIWSSISHQGTDKVSAHLRTGCLRRYLEQISEEVTGGWTELHNEELHDLYPAQNIIWVLK